MRTITVILTIVYIVYILINKPIKPLSGKIQPLNNATWSWPTDPSIPLQLKRSSIVSSSDIFRMTLSFYQTLLNPSLDPHFLLMTPMEFLSDPFLIFWVYNNMTPFPDLFEITIIPKGAYCVPTCVYLSAKFNIVCQLVFYLKIME